MSLVLVFFLVFISSSEKTWKPHANPSSEVFLIVNSVLDLLKQWSGHTESIELADDKSAAWLSAKTPDQLQGWCWSREAEGDVLLHKEKQREQTSTLPWGLDFLSQSLCVYITWRLYYTNLLQCAVRLCSRANYLKLQVLTSTVPSAADQRSVLPVWGLKKAQDINYDLQQETKTHH